jgi:ABC-type Fe3+ transport system permease subunit
MRIQHASLAESYFFRRTEISSNRNTVRRNRELVVIPLVLFCFVLCFVCTLPLTHMLYHSFHQHNITKCLFLFQEQEFLDLLQDCCSFGRRLCLALASVVSLGM